MRAVRGAPSLVDEREDHPIERAQRGAEAQVRGRRHGDRDGDQLLQPLDRVVEDDGERAPDGVGLVGEIAREQAAPQDLEGEARQLGDEIEGGAARPRAPQPLDEGGRGGGHRGGEGAEALLVEGGLGEAAVAAPGRTGGGEQPGAERRAQGRHAAGLAAVVVGVVLEDAFDARGIADEVNVAAAQAQAGDGTVAPGDVEEEAERVGAELGERAEEAPVGGPGGGRRIGRRIGRGAGTRESMADARRPRGKRPRRRRVADQRAAGTS